MPYLQTLAGRNMASCPAEWTRAKQLHIDGVLYDICVLAREGQFKSAWVCSQCMEQGPSDRTWPTAEVATERAEVGLKIHHAFVHGPPLPVPNTCQSLHND